MWNAYYFSHVNLPNAYTYTLKLHALKMTPNLPKKKQAQREQVACPMAEQRFKHKPLYSNASQMKTESIVLFFVNKIENKCRHYEYIYKYQPLHREGLEGNSILSSIYV